MLKVDVVFIDFIYRILKLLQVIYLLISAFNKNVLRMHKILVFSSDFLLEIC